MSLHSTNRQDDLEKCGSRRDKEHQAWDWEVCGEAKVRDHKLERESEGRRSALLINRGEGEESGSRNGNESETPGKV